jgi:very-short-patch-repair endonuclease
VAGGRRPRQAGVIVHRRGWLAASDVTEHDHIPVTAIALTLVDITPTSTQAELVRAINEADKHDLIDPEALRVAMDAYSPLPGAARLRKELDRLTFVLTESELERAFLPIARHAGLSPPHTGAWVNGFKVDFYWPDLALVVETDGLRYHRTPAQQTADRRRDQAHIAAGTIPLRFTHAQVTFESEHVQRTLGAALRRQSRARAA